MSRLNVANFRHPDGTVDNINLDNSGRVGIGTASPSRPLHVNGGQVLFQETAASSNAVLRLKGSSTSNGGAIIAQSSSDGAAPLQFWSGSTQTAEIDSSSNLQFNSGYGSVATAYGVRAWINFDGTSGTIGDGRADGNMDAVTDHGTGSYTCNFTNDMPDANYIAFGSVIGSSNTDATNGFLNGGTNAATGTHTASAFRFMTLHINNGATDYNQVQVGVIR